jgi:hypothetical protein
MIVLHTYQRYSVYILISNRLANVLQYKFRKKINKQAFFYLGCGCEIWLHTSEPTHKNVASRAHYV